MPAAAPPPPVDAPADAPVTADGLTRRFGDRTVVDDLDLVMARDRISGFIGPSGSGKTTTVRMLTGVLAPTEGTVRVFGTDPRRLSTSQRQQIGYMPQLGVLYPHLTVVDNLRFVASLYGVRRRQRRIGEVLELLDMGPHRDLRLEHASGGMQRRVALAAALLHDPLLLFLDEPTSGLDPVLRRTIWAHLQDLRDRGRTVVVTTQIVSEATMCDTVGLIADGALLAEGEPDELRREAEGGDVVDLHTDARIDAAAIEALLAQDVVSTAVRTGRDGRTVRVTVPDAEAAADRLGPVLEAHGLSLRLAERYLTPFDDVFVALVQRRDAALPGGADDAGTGLPTFPGAEALGG